MYTNGCVCILKYNFVQKASRRNPFFPFSVMHLSRCQCSEFGRVLGINYSLPPKFNDFRTKPNFGTF